MTTPTAQPSENIIEIVGGDAEVDRLAARCGHEGAQPGAVRIGDPGGAERLAGRPDFIAGRQDRDPRPTVDLDPFDTRAGDERDRGGRDGGTRSEEHRARLEVASRRTYGTALADRRMDQARGGQRTCGITAACRTTSPRRACSGRR